MGWKPKGNPCKIKGIPRGWEPRKKLRIILEGEKDVPQKGLLPSYERNPNHWGSPLRSNPPNYLSLAHKLSCTSEGPHNTSFEPRNTLQEHTSQKHDESTSVASHHWEGQNQKNTQKPTKVKLPKDTPPICLGGRDAHHDLQQRRKIPTHGREDVVINLWFSHYSNKFLNNGA